MSIDPNSFEVTSQKIPKLLLRTTQTDQIVGWAQHNQITLIDTVNDFNVHKHLN